MTEKQTDREPAASLESPACPLPLRNYPEVVLGHGGGGQLSRELVEHLFLPAFRNEPLAELSDAAVVTIEDSTIALATDSFVVRPLFFPGGDIGELAVHGTINDLAMVGAAPRFLTAGFIIEEGFPMEQLAQIVESMGRAAERAGVPVVTGDTKVVERGHGDGCYINTSGIGLLEAGRPCDPRQVVPGDAILLSGTIADHGMAIMSVREGLEFEAAIESDTAPLHRLVQAMRQAGSSIHAMRDPTRGGVAAALNEIAQQARVGIEIDDNAVPISPIVQSACEMLGLDPLAVANEGKLIAFVPPDEAEAVLQAMRHDPLGRQAALIGRVVDEHPGQVVARTTIGASRVVTTQIGEALPRIC